MAAPPKFFDAQAVAAALPWDALINAIEHTVTDDAAHAPARTVHTIPVPDGADASLLLKAGWVAVSYTHLTLPTIYSV